MAEDELDSGGMDAVSGGWGTYQALYDDSPIACTTCGKSFRPPAPGYTTCPSCAPFNAF